MDCTSMRTIIFAVFMVTPAWISTSARAQGASEPPPSEAANEAGVKTKKSKKNSKASGVTKSQKNKEARDDADEAPTAPEVKNQTEIPKARKFGLGLNGGFIYLGGGAGLESWYSPSKNLDLSVRVVGSSTKIAATGEAYYLETAQITMMQLGLHARYFFGGSFYVLGGLGYNTYTGSYGVTVNSTKEEVLLPMKASAMSLNLAIGNMWKWSNGLTLGFDWIGYSSFMGTNLKLDDPQTDQEQSVFTDFRTIPGGGDPTEKAKTAITKNNIYAAMMTLGYMF